MSRNKFEGAITRSRRKLIEQKYVADELVAVESAASAINSVTNTSQTLSEQKQEAPEKKAISEEEKALIKERNKQYLEHKNKILENVFHVPLENTRIDSSKTISIHLPLISNVSEIYNARSEGDTYNVAHCRITVIYSVGDKKYKDSIMLRKSSTGSSEKVLRMSDDNITTPKKSRGKEEVTLIGNADLFADDTKNNEPTYNSFYAKINNLAFHVKDNTFGYEFEKQNHQSCLHTESQFVARLYTDYDEIFEYYTDRTRNVDSVIYEYVTYNSPCNYCLLAMNAMLQFSRIKHVNVINMVRISYIAQYAGGVGDRKLLEGSEIPEAADGKIFVTKISYDKIRTYKDNCRNSPATHATIKSLTPRAAAERSGDSKVVKCATSKVKDSLQWKVITTSDNTLLSPRASRRPVGEAKTSSRGKGKVRSRSRRSLRYHLQSRDNAILPENGEVDAASAYRAKGGSDAIKEEADISSSSLSSSKNRASAINKSLDIQYILSTRKRKAQGHVTFADSIERPGKRRDMSNTDRVAQNAASVSSSAISR